MNEDEQVIWVQPVSFQDFVQKFQPNQKILNPVFTPFFNKTPMQAAMKQIQSPEAQTAYWNATHPQTTNETPIVAQSDGTFRRETRNIPLNTSAEAAKTALEFTPVVGDVLYAGDVADEARRGNYSTAAALAGLALLPNYAEKPLKKGLRKIGLFGNATTASKTFHTVSDIDYRGKAGDIDYIKKLAAENKIQGKPAWTLGNIDFFTGKPVGFSSDVSKGLSWEAKEDLMNNTVKRNLREFRKEGYDDLSRLQYQEKVKDLLDNVNVGRYTNEDYVKASAEGLGGFYDDARNFISVNTDNPTLPRNRIEAHEGRHLIDYNTSMLDSQYDLLSKAYDDDFLNIPNTEFAGTLKDYKLMNKERVTTNRDSRNVLLSNKDLNNRSLKEQDTYIDNASNEEIFNAVENSNGYGRKFIKFLKANNKLTSQKAQELRKAMKYVGGYAAPVAIGGTAAASYANQQRLGGVQSANKFYSGGNIINKFKNRNK